MLKASLGFMFSYGFRARSQPGHHVAIIEFVRSRIDKKHSGLLTLFDRLRRKRNLALYDDTGFVSRVPVSKADANLLRQFAVALTRAMPQAEVRRVVVVSVAFLFKDAVIPPAYLFGRLLFPDIVADSSAMESAFEKSGLDWTIVRPPKLTDNPYTGKYRVREGHLPSFGFKISRADVADFMLNVIERPTTIGKIIGVSS